ncbi:uncharacterized protein METZ01_LOCUS202253 [marine metagenome]|uniref:Uncharacterized protein n=1 Tax=marine metagenome TaxID=408172 RepID=A0A382EG98_9ZZZZ
MPAPLVGPSLFPASAVRTPAGSAR